MSSSLHDPLLHLEQQKTTFFHSFRRTLKWISLYFLISGTVFGVLLSILNYSAYSSRIVNWINPEALLTARDEVQNILSASSVEVHASENTAIEHAESLEAVTEKISASNPEMIYGRSYSPEHLLGSISENTKKTSFSVTPYENRLIIPRINKNVPLIDVSVDAHADFDTMHEVFMEELKK